MNVMKKKLLALLLVLACLCLSGCQLMEDIESAATDSALALVAEKAEESGADALARQFVDGLLAEDAEMCLAAMAPGVTMEALQEVFPQMCEMLPDADGYSLTPMYWNTRTGSDATQHTFQFRLEVARQPFLLQTVQVSTMERLYNINIAPITEESEGKPEAQRSVVFDILSVLLTIASCAVTLWALIHCARHQMKRKWLWVLLVLLGSVLLTVTLNGSRMNFHFRLGLHLVASQIVPYSGGFALKLVLPVGPIIYLVRRKALTAPPKEAFAEAFSDVPEASAPQAVEAEPVQEEPHEPEEV